MQNYIISDPITGTKDLNEEFITDQWYIDRYLGNALFACGYNSNGQLGNGASTTTKYSSPIQIGSLTNWKQVFCGLDFTMAVKTDGTLWGWGRNTTGQLGNGTMINYSSPIQIGSLTDWKQVSAGVNHVVAVRLIT